MKASAGYVKVVEWSDEDQCYVGSCAGLFYGGCHGCNEEAVFVELCALVEEAIELYHNERRVLPPPMGRRDYTNKML
jgi:predicted RNase H-like HicB family nuclease